jgi:SAM-dependent methyltransferase
VIGEHVAVLDLFGAVEPYVPPERYREALRLLELAVNSRSNYQKNCGSARAFYHAVFAPDFYVATELGMIPRRLCVDLNETSSFGRTFDYVINNGTTEHVFDQANVYRLIHDATRPGGVMIHWLASQGWCNHGMFHVQPGFFFDLAGANGYDVKLVGMVHADIFMPLAKGDDFQEAFVRHHQLRFYGGLCAILHKTEDRAFRKPFQGYYQGGWPEQHALAKMGATR